MSKFNNFRDYWELVENHGTDLEFAALPEGASNYLSYGRPARWIVRYVNEKITSGQESSAIAGITILANILHDSTDRDTDVWITAILYDCLNHKNWKIREATLLGMYHADVFIISELVKLKMKSEKDERILLLYREFFENTY